MPKDKTGCYICKHAKTENLHGRQEVRCCLDDMLVMRPSKGCNYCEKKALSNADRIRQMTGDEDLLNAIGLTCYRCVYNDGNGKCSCKSDYGCHAGNIEWLRKEVDEDAGTD